MTGLQAQYRERAGLETDIRAQLPVLYAHARHAETVIELGVRGGNSTAALLAGCERGGGRLWSVDVEQPRVPAEWHQVPFWRLLVADDVSAEAAAFCPAGADVLFIDTSHAYDHTLAELRLYVPKVRPGGIVLLHDTDRLEWPGVGAALDDYCAETGADWYDHPGWHGLGVIEVPRA
jgi:predicted O-methyltransferase YrrM